IAILNPSPSAPTRFAAGTRASSKRTSDVSEARCPILSSFFPEETPGVSPGPVRRSEHGVLGGVGAVRDEAFPAVQHVGVAVPPGRRGDRARVGARPRLG